MLLSYLELRELVEQGVIQGVDPAAINQSSIDVRLGRHIMIEDSEPKIISLRKREGLPMSMCCIPKFGFVMRPNQFILAETVEKFYLPDHISAEFKLKSSGARSGLDHLLAGWLDAGWHGSVITLELKNVSEFHSIHLLEGDWVGQVTFFKHTKVPEEQSYSKRGRYNGDETVSGVKA